MKTEEIEDLRKTYNYYIKDAKELKKLLKKIKEYENIPIIKDYNDCINRYNQLQFTYYSYSGKGNDYFLSKAVRTINITPTYDTYVYLGSFRYNLSRNPKCDHLVEFNDPYTNYVIFKNIELPDYAANSLVRLDLAGAKEFIKKHNIIYPENTDNHSLYFYNLQLKFFKTLINDGEEEALKLLNKR